MSKDKKNVKAIIDAGEIECYHNGKILDIKTCAKAFASWLGKQNKLSKKQLSDNGKKGAEKRWGK